MSNGHTIDTSVAILVSFLDHLINFSLGKILAESLHDLTELICIDGSTVVSVEDSESLAEFRICVRRLDLAAPRIEWLNQVMNRTWRNSIT